MRNGDMPASPQSVSRSDDGAVISSADFAGCEGLSKREAFAMAAMQGLLTGITADGVISYEEVADDSRRCADALLAELEATNEQR